MWGFPQVARLLWLTSGMSETSLQLAYWVTLLGTSAGPCVWVIETVEYVTISEGEIKNKILRNKPLTIYHVPGTKDTKSMPKVRTYENCSGLFHQNSDSSSIKPTSPFCNSCFVIFSLLFLNENHRRCNLTLHVIKNIII